MFLILFILALIVLIDFLGFLFSGRRILHQLVFHFIEVFTMIILPLMYADFTAENDCCSDALGTATFSPEHHLTVKVLLLLCLASYFFCSYRKKITTPLIEVLLNCFLVIGIIFSIFVSIHAREAWLILGGSVPVIMCGLLTLIKNQQIFWSQAENIDPGNNRFGKITFSILCLNPLIKYPVILLLCLPITVILSSVLLLFGQKPDSIIRAFTETYKQGLSQWDYKCDNVQCGGHYLCSVAANGHKKIVKPQRKGVRNGHGIICNRQLLIANAFEELIQEKFPSLHKVIRKNYNHVGNFIHRYYGVFENKFVSDVIYILMKPPEWVFLITLYTCDKKPENRITKQYLDKFDIKNIDGYLKSTSQNNK